MGKAIILRSEDSDLSEFARSIDLREALNRLGGALSEISSYALVLHESQEKAGASANKVDVLEREILSLETVNLDKKVKYERLEKETNEKLMRAGMEIEELKANLGSLEAEKKDLQLENYSLLTSEKRSRVELEVLQDQMKEYSSPQFRSSIIETFKTSTDFKALVEKDSLIYLDRGMAHMVRQLHGHFEDKSQLVEAFETYFAAPEARGGADFVPFSDDEVSLLAKYDESKGLPAWTPPMKTTPSFFDLVATAGLPLSEAGTSMVETEKFTEDSVIPPPTQ